MSAMKLETVVEILRDAVVSVQDLDEYFKAGEPIDADDATELEDGIIEVEHQLASLKEALERYGIEVTITSTTIVTV